MSTVTYEGRVYLRIDLPIDEITKWEPERIRSFFAGLAALNGATNAALPSDADGLRNALDDLAVAIHDHGLQGDILFWRPFRTAMQLLGQHCGCCLCAETATRYAPATEENAGEEALDAATDATVRPRVVEDHRGVPAAPGEALPETGAVEGGGAAGGTP